METLVFEVGTVASALCGVSMETIVFVLGKLAVAFCGSLLNIIKAECYNRCPYRSHGTKLEVACRPYSGDGYTSFLLVDVSSSNYLR